MERNMHILFEDSQVCVIAKPSGVAVHRDGKREEETIADWFAARFPEAKDVGEPLVLTNGTTVDRPGIVHRLDKETSGVMLLAKTQEAFLFLKAQFQKRQVEKTYRAFVWGVMKKDEGSITRPIGRSRSDFRKRSAEFGAKPPLREAHTNYTVIARAGGFSYVEAKPLTGRMHQLRVHLKSQGNPIVCDRLYMPRRECALGFTRLALHALSITVQLLAGEQRTFIAPAPEDFARAEATFKSTIA